jgi:hypothetical protein
LRNAAALHAAGVVNRIRDVRTIEREFDSLGPELEEPWHDSSAR